MGNFADLRCRTSKRYRIYKHLKYNKEFESPITLEIFPTNKCNTSCSFCAFQFIKNAEEIPQDRFQLLIEDIIKMKIKAVVFSGGGEPLIYPNIHKYIYQLTSNGVDVGIITNGLFLNNDILAALKKCKWIRVSLLASNSENFAKITGTPAKNFHIICSNIDKITKLSKNCGDLTVGATYMMPKEGYSKKDLFDFIDLSSELYLEQVFVTRQVQNFRPDKNEKILCSNIEEIINYADSKKVVTNLQKFVSNESSIYSSRNKYTPCNLIRCNALALISANGFCYPCLYQYVNKGTMYGDINFERLEKILSFSNRRNGINNIETTSCSFCRHWAVRQEIEQYKQTAVSKQCNDPHYNFI